MKENAPSDLDRTVAGGVFLSPYTQVLVNTYTFQLKYLDAGAGGQ